MTRQEAETQIIEHFKAIIEIAKQYDPDTDFLDLAAFASSGYMSVTNAKDDDKRLNCCILSAEHELFSR